MEDRKTHEIPQQMIDIFDTFNNDQLKFTAWLLDMNQNTKRKLQKLLCRRNIAKMTK